MISAEFGVPADALNGAVETILGPHAEQLDRVPVMRDLPLPDADPRRWPPVRDAIRRAIVASATPGRDDRLFPGDVAQFDPGGGLNLAFGAAGVLFALAVTGAGRFPEYEQWLRTRALDPARPVRPGFYEGQHGIAYVLDLLGHHDDARELATRGGPRQWDALETGLFGGLAGIGLNTYSEALILQEIRQHGRFPEALFVASDEWKGVMRRTLGLP